MNYFQKESGNAVLNKNTYEKKKLLAKLHKWERKIFFQKNLYMLGTNKLEGN